jgi:hypothetical protein
VKCLHRIIVILGVALVTLAPIVCRVDAPENAYDETDTPFSLFTPVIVGTNLTSPEESIGAIREEQLQSPEFDIATHEVTPKPGMYNSHSLLILLCKFLC